MTQEGQREKQPGHEIMLAVAREATADPAKLRRMPDEEREEILKRLSVQAFARVDDIIPEDHLEHVVEEVLTAAMLTADEFDLSIPMFIVSQIGEEGFYNLLDRIAQGLGEKWVQVVSLLGTTFFVTAEKNEEIWGSARASVQALGMPEDALLIGPEVVWESSNTEDATSDDDEEEDAADANEASGDAETGDEGADDEMPGDAGRLNQ